MIVEGFFSGLMSSIIKDLLVQVSADRSKRFDEEEIEKVVAAYLARYQGPLATIITKEIATILQDSGFIDANGQVTLTLPEDKKTQNRLFSLLEKNYGESVKRRLGSAISSELQAGPSQRGTTGLVQHFEGSKDDPVRASLCLRDPEKSCSDFDACLSRY
jgi:hypothetical protein